MVDVKELEKRWFKYKLKQYLPYSLLALSSIVIVIILFSIDSEKKELVQMPIEKKQKLQQEQKEYLQTSQQKAIQKTNTPQTQPQEIRVQKEQNTTPLYAIQQNSLETTQVLEPDMSFLHKLKSNTVYPTYTQQKKQKHTQKKKTKKVVKKKTTKKPKKERVVQTSQPSNSTITITTKKTSQEVRERIEKRFKKTNNPVLSLFLAREYYKIGNYLKAYNYALITNKIDSSIEDSWIIFAKSLVKLNKKHKALEALDAYIQTSHSKKAQVLAEQIRSGKFQ
ncbi:MAG: hypothetical protein GXO11_07010 [Epsilonproteobacteria bacterium]|nr:hypothetical protein [Campylobacterota bacterium]